MSDPLADDLAGALKALDLDAVRAHYWAQDEFLVLERFVPASLVAGMLTEVDRVNRIIEMLLDLGRPVLVGPSRKRFIGANLDLPEQERVEGTAAAVAWMVARGAHVVRVHDVRETVDALKVWTELR